MHQRTLHQHWVARPINVSPSERNTGAHCSATMSSSSLFFSARIIIYLCLTLSFAMLPAILPPIELFEEKICFVCTQCTMTSRGNLNRCTISVAWRVGWKGHQCLLVFDWPLPFVFLSISSGRRLCCILSGMIFLARSGTGACVLVYARDHLERTSCVYRRFHHSTLLNE